MNAAERAAASAPSISPLSRVLLLPGSGALQIMPIAVVALMGNSLHHLFNKDLDRIWSTKRKVDV
jgi:hypothetical protein